MEQIIDGRTWIICAILADSGHRKVGVHALFDANKSETFDVTEAVEMMTDEGFRIISLGDEIRITLNEI